MTDLAALARGARETLAEARGATLLVEGLGRVPADAAEVLLHDRDGSPTFLCEAGSPITSAAQACCPAVLSVPVHQCAGGPRAVGSVIFVGTLTLVGAEAVDGVVVDVVELRLASVIVECDDPASTNVVQQVIPLDEYGISAPLTIASAADTMRTHTNARHQTELREFVAQREQLPLGSVAGAELTALDETGAEVQWVDASGAHRARLRFPHAARDHRELSALLRAALAYRYGAMRGPESDGT